MPSRTPPAVCVPRAARLVVRDVPRRMQQEYGIVEEAEATFVRLDVRPCMNRDGVRFDNGRAVLPQEFQVGQRADVPHVPEGCRAEELLAVSSTVASRPVGVLPAYMPETFL